MGIWAAEGTSFPFRGVTKLITCCGSTTKADGAMEYKHPPEHRLLYNSICQISPWVIKQCMKISLRHNQ
jgi:hypothetical protein